MKETRRDSSSLFYDDCDLDHDELDMLDEDGKADRLRLGDRGEENSQNRENFEEDISHGKKGCSKRISRKRESSFEDLRSRKVLLLK